MSFTVSATAARAVASPAFVSKASSKVRFVSFRFVFIARSSRELARDATRDRDFVSSTPPARAAREDGRRVGRTRASTSARDAR